jgi:hypothetical protein
VTDHAVTRDVDWPAVLADTRLASSPLPAGFTPLVRVREAPAIAVRPSPRQVWVGFDAPAFASSVDYVVFWTNVLDFTGEGADQWPAAPETQFVRVAEAEGVQKRVQNLAPGFVLGAVSLTLLSLLAVSRRAQIR